MSDNWPELLQSQWSETQATLHLWTQVVGKIRLAQESLVNHWWNVALYVTSRGLTTSPMPYSDGRSFTIDFDFLAHRLSVYDCREHRREIALTSISVAEFYSKVMNALREIDIDVQIRTMPSEIADAIPFERDTVHATYQAEYAERFWRILLQTDRVCKSFRAEFLGKSSPVHFFWGSFDLAFTRFSGRSAPTHAGGIPNLPDRVTREAYSHEEHSVGFWPGGFGMEAAFYAYAYPEPAGFAGAVVQPAAASWNTQLKEFVLPYSAVRSAANPTETLLAFFQSTYRAAADAALWDRAGLERTLS